MKPPPYRDLEKRKLSVLLPTELFQKLHAAIGKTGRSYSEEIAHALAVAYGVAPARYGIAPTPEAEAARR